MRTRKYTLFKAFVAGNMSPFLSTYTQTFWKCGFQQDEKHPYLRHETVGLVILVQGFITRKMDASRLALWEPSQEASVALQLL